MAEGEPMAEAATPASETKPESGSGTPPPPPPPKDPVIDAKTFNLGLAESAGHKGTLTVNDNAPIESTILAYRVIHKLAHHISARVVDVNTGKLPVFFHNAADFAALRELRACTALCDEYAALFEQLIKDSKPLLPKALIGTPQLKTILPELITGFAVVSGLLSSGLQLLSLFRTDQDIKSYKIDVEDQVLAITVAGYLKRQKEFDVFASAIVPVDPLAESKIMSTLHGLNKTRSELSKILERLANKDNAGSADAASDADVQDTELDSVSDIELAEQINRLGSPATHEKAPDAEASHEQNAGDKEHKEPLPNAIAKRLQQTSKNSAGGNRARLRVRISDALKDFDAFQQGLCKTDEKLGTTALSRILAGESLNARLAKGGYILWVKAVVAGGMAHSRVSTGESSLTYGAGAVVSYAIFSSDGSLVEANTIPLYGGKVKVDELPETKLGMDLYEEEKDPVAVKAKRQWWYPKSWQ